MGDFFDSLVYHGILAMGFAAIVIGGIPFLKVLAAYLPGHGLQEAVAA